MLRRCRPIVSGVGEYRNNGDGRIGGTTVTITNDQLAGHTFLAPLYEDDYFPDADPEELIAEREW